jgi:hypothetical protein
LVGGDMVVINRKTRRRATAVEFAGPIDSNQFISGDRVTGDRWIIVDDNGERLLTSRDGLYLDYTIEVPTMAAAYK